MLRPTRLIALLAAAATAPSVFDSIQKDVAPDDGPKYNVQLMTGALRMPPSAPSVVMTKKGGKKYRCYLPEEEAEGEAATDGSVAKPEESVASYLLPIKGTCFYRLEGWWTYEFCFMKSVRQFHQEKFKNQQKEEQTAITQDNTLGAYWVDPQAASGTVRGELLDDVKTKRKYFKQEYGNGTLCDLTGKPRESELRLNCAPGEPSYLASIEEVATCKYVVQFSSNLLCKHPAFAADKKKESVDAIQCEPLDARGKPLPPPKRAPSPPADSSGTSGSGAGAAAAKQGAKGAAAGGASQAAQAKESPESPTELAFDVGQCLLHRRYNYRGAIVGFDRTCQQSEAWIRSMNVDTLKYGRNQPFYHVLPDTRDRPGAQLTYVAQENILPDTPSEPLQHPMVSEMFDEFDAANGRFVPNAQLRAQYPAEAR